MKKRSANMRVSAVIWDLECKAMSQACWLHCCCCKLTQDKGHKWECNYDCSMPMRCSRISTGKRSSIYRGKFKAQLQALTSRFISSKNKVSSLVWLWQASINKKTTLKNTKLSKSKLNTKGKAGFRLWDSKMCRHVTLNRSSRTLSSKSACTHIWTASRWAESHDMETMAADERCNCEYEYMRSFWVLSRRLWTIRARIVVSE